jgi:hypothetical protein
MSPAELHLFYEQLVRDLRNQGVVCAITSGLACVHYGIAETTEDCDLLCHPGSFDLLLATLSMTRVNNVQCRYRGKLSPPLDVRWHNGGWTSHFEWAVSPSLLTLDIFGQAVRQSSPWEHELTGLYAGMNVVAEMKRTDRPKDWPFITSLGVKMLQQGDGRGWLHIFEAEVFGNLRETFPLPEELKQIRPVLALACESDSMLRFALMPSSIFGRNWTG